MSDHKPGMERNHIPSFTCIRTKKKCVSNYDTRYIFLPLSSVRSVRALKRIWRIRMLCIQFQKVIQFLHCFQLIFMLFAIMKECVRRRRKNPHTRTGCNGYNVKSVRRNHQMRFTIEIRLNGASASTRKHNAYMYSYATHKFRICVLV